MTTRSNRAQQQRGIIAIMAGVSLFFVVALGISIAELGLNVVHSFEAHNAAESVALTEAMVVLSTPSPWDSAIVPTDRIVPGNSRSTESPANFQFMPVPSQTNGPDSPLDAPGVTNSVVSGPLQNFGSMLQQPQLVGGTAATAVYQYNVNKLVPVLSRIVMVLDYSKSMRLYYAGYDQQTGAGLTALRNAGLRAITNNNQNLQSRVNWGLIRFAGTVETDPVPLTDVNPGDAISQAQLTAKQSAMKARLVAGTGSGMTDMASAVRYATGMLDNNGAKTGLRSPYLGNGVILLVTDGEPDWDPSDPTDNPLTYTNRVNNAENNVRAAVRDAWSKGYQTMTITVWTNTKHEPPQTLTGFMKDISGNADGKQTSDGNNALIAYSPTDIPAWLAQVNPATHCLSAQKVDLSGSPWMNLPGANDNVYGYYVNGGAPRYIEADTIRARNPKLMDPNQAANYTWDTNQKGQFYWNPTDQIAELNVTLCVKYIQQQNMNPPPQFRMRWGVPRVYSAQKLKTGG